MFKQKIPEKISFKNKILVLFFPGKGNSTVFTLSLLTTNYPFKNIGYLFSEYLSSSVSYSENGKGELEFNGTFFLNEPKNIILLNLTGGIKNKYLSEFAEELTNFIKLNNFKEIYIIGASGKDEANDIDLVSKKINIYYLTNNTEFQNICNMKSIKEAFKEEEKKRKGKTYYEMNLIDGCESLKRVVQKLILEKIKFVFIFGFANPLFDPFCAMGLYWKTAKLTGLGEKDEEVNRVELDNIQIIDNFKNQGVKINECWKTLFILD